MPRAYSGKTLMLGLLALLASCGGHDDAAAPPPPECPPSYQLTFLPLPLFKSTSSAVSVNNLQQAVGEIGGDAALWSGGSFSAIVNAFGGFNSTASGINDSTIIVGGAETTTPNVFRAFRYSSGTMVDLGTLGGSGSFAAGINNAGQIVGKSDTAGNVATHAFLYEAGTMTDLGTLGGSTSSATAINGSGQIVGIAQVSGNTANHAFFYANGTIQDLGTLGGQESSATAINDLGQIVGSAQMAGSNDDHAFFYSTGTMRELIPSTVSVASGINAKGHVVGRLAAASSPTGWHAFRYCGGQATDLNQLIPGGGGAELLDASDINDQGAIVGVGTQAGSSTEQAILLTPQ